MDKKTENFLLFVIVSIFFTSSYYAQTFGLEVNAANRMSDDSFDEYFCVGVGFFLFFFEVIGVREVFLCIGGRF